MRELVQEVITPEEGLDDAQRRYQEQLDVQAGNLDPGMQSPFHQQLAEQTDRANAAEWAELERQTAPDPAEAAEWAERTGRPVEEIEPATKPDEKDPAETPRNDTSAVEPEGHQESDDIQAVAELSDSQVEDLTNPGDEDTARVLLSLGDDAWDRLKERRLDVAAQDAKDKTGIKDIDPSNEAQREVSDKIDARRSRAKDVLEGRAAATEPGEGDDVDEPEDVKAVKELSAQDALRIAASQDEDAARANLSLSDEAWSALKDRVASGMTQTAANQTRAQGKTVTEESVQATTLHNSEVLDERRKIVKQNLEESAEDGAQQGSEPKDRSEESRDISPELAERMKQKGVTPEAIDALMAAAKNTPMLHGEELSFGYKLYGGTNEKGEHVAAPDSMDLDDELYQLELADAKRNTDTLTDEQRKKLAESGMSDPYSAAKTHHVNTFFKHMANDKSGETLEGEALYERVVDMLEGLETATQKGQELFGRPKEQRPFEDDAITGNVVQRMFERRRRRRLPGYKNRQQEQGVIDDNTDESATEDEAPANEKPSASELYAQARKAHRREIADQFKGDLGKAGAVGKVAAKGAAITIASPVIGTIAAAKGIGKLRDLTPRGKQLAYYKEQFGPMSNEQKMEASRPARERRSRETMANLDLTTNSEGEPRTSYRDLREQLAAEEQGDDEQGDRFQGVPLARDRGRHAPKL